MRRTPGPKPVAVIRKRPVPLALQNLHYRLLNESIQHRRNRKLPLPSSIRLGDFYPFHRLRLISSAQQLFPYGWPVLFRNSGSSRTVVPSTPALPLLALTRASACLQFYRSQPSTINCLPIARLSVPRFTTGDSVPSSNRFGASLLPSSAKANTSWFFCRLSLMSCAAYLPFH